MQGPLRIAGSSRYAEVLVVLPVIMSIALRRKLRQVHRILGLVVGLQVLFWVAGGLFMSAFPIETVRGEHRMRATIAEPLAADPALLAPARILATYPGTTELSLRRWLGQPVYVTHGGGRSQLIDARSGTPLSPISAEQAEALARRDYAGDAGIAHIELIREGRTEIRGRPLPLWQVRFDDSLATSVYISADTGQIVARRNHIWRAFDVVWMLHIMDYRERDNFNNPLLIAFAATTLAFVLSGLGMLWFSWRRDRRMV